MGRALVPGAAAAILAALRVARLAFFSARRPIVLTRAESGEKNGDGWASSPARKSST